MNMRAPLSWLPGDGARPLEGLCFVCHETEVTPVGSNLNDETQGIQEMHAPRERHKTTARQSIVSSNARPTRSVMVCLSLAVCFLLSCAQTAEDSALRIFAAASLRDAFHELKREFETRHPNSHVQLSFAGSHILRLQLQNGAPADLFASAHQSHLEDLVKSKKILSYFPFATNQIALITPRRNPAGIAAYSDLPKAQRLVVGLPEVPIGHYTEQVLRRSGQRLGEQFRQEVMAKIVSRETNSRFVRAKVELGAADAAFVYQTDALSSQRVNVVPLSDEDNVTVRYFSGALKASSKQTMVKRWESFLLSQTAQTILQKYGFGRQP